MSGTRSTKRGSISTAAGGRNRRIQRSNVLNVPDICIPANCPVTSSPEFGDFSPMSVKTLPTPHARLEGYTPNARAPFEVSQTPHFALTRARLSGLLEATLKHEETNEMDAATHTDIEQQLIQTKQQQEFLNKFIQEQQTIIDLTQKHALQQQMFNIQWKSESPSDLSSKDPPVPESEEEKELYYKEKRLVNLIELCLTEAKTNKFHGSIPVVTVQKMTKDRGSEEYGAVVDNGHGGSFHDFIALQRFAKFKIRHYSDEEIEKNNLIHCSAHEGRLAFGDITDEVLLQRDTQTADWRKGMWEIVYKQVNRIIEPEPLLMKNLMKRLREDDKELAEQYCAVLPSNHSLKQLLRKQPDMFFVTNDSTVKLPSQMTEKEVEEQRLSFEKKKNIEMQASKPKANKQNGRYKNHNAAGSQASPTSHHSSPEHQRYMQQRVILQRQDVGVMQSHQQHPQQQVMMQNFPLPGHQQDQVATQFTNQLIPQNRVAHIHNQHQGVNVVGHNLGQVQNIHIQRGYESSPPLSNSSHYSPDMLRMQPSPSINSSCMSTPSVSLNAQFSPYVGVDHLVHNRGAQTIGNPFIPIGQQYNPFAALEAQKFAFQSQPIANNFTTA